MTLEEKIKEYLNKLYLKDMDIRNSVKKGILFGIELCKEEIKNKDGIIASQSDALNKEYFINESLNSKLKNICGQETDIENTLSDYENGKYDDDEHQFVVDAFVIMNGILNDIRGV